MSQKKNLTKHIIAAGVLIISVMTFVSCEKYTWEKPVIKPSTDPVYFQTDIVPIFTSNCSCHQGSISPDLRPGTAYNALKNGGFLTTDSPDQPETCKLYKAIISTEHANRTSTTDAEKQKILSWIYQGALDN